MPRQPIPPPNNQPFQTQYKPKPESPPQDFIRPDQDSANFVPGQDLYNSPPHYPQITGQSQGSNWMGGQTQINTKYHPYEGSEY